MPPMLEELTRVAIDAAKLAGDRLRNRFGDGDLKVRAKAEHDFVTEADQESEQLILGALRDRFPEHLVLSEEIGLVGPREAEYRWVIDPLDGTSNFLKGLPIWSVSIACRDRHQTVAAAVYDPLRDDLFSATKGLGAYLNGETLHVSQRRSLSDAFLATGFPFRARGALDVYLDIFRQVFLHARGIRRCGSAALDLAYTAAGTFDGFFEFRLSSWDIAAGELLIREAGGVITDLDGEPNFLRSGNVLAGPMELHRELVAKVGDFASESRLDDLAPLEEAVPIA